MSLNISRFIDNEDPDHTQIGPAQSLLGGSRAGERNYGPSGKTFYWPPV